MYKKKNRHRTFQQLNEVDQILRTAKNPGMNTGIICTITMFNEFEGFGHYEDFAIGYKVTDGDISVKREFLDDAVKEFAVKVEERKNIMKDVVE